MDGHFHRLLAGGVRCLHCAAPRTHLLLAHPVQLGQTVCFEDACCAHGRCPPCFQYTTACPVLSVYKCGASSQQGSRPLGQAPAPVSLTKRKSGRGYRARRAHPLHLANRSDRHSCLSSCLPLSGGKHACRYLPGGAGGSGKSRSLVAARLLGMTRKAPGSKAKGEQACKPDSVPRASGAAIIPLGPELLPGSSDLPESVPRSPYGPRLRSGPLLLSYLVLLRVGFSLPRTSPSGRCALTLSPVQRDRTFSPLPRPSQRFPVVDQRRGGIFSVALIRTGPAPLPRWLK